VSKLRNSFADYGAYELCQPGANTTTNSGITSPTNGEPVITGNLAFEPSRVILANGCSFESFLIPDRLAVAAAGVGGAEADGGFFLDHDALGVAQGALLGEGVAACGQGALGVAR